MRKVPAFRSHRYISSLLRPRNITSSGLSASPSPLELKSGLEGDFPEPVICFLAGAKLPLDLFERAAEDVEDEVIGVPILHTKGLRLFVPEGGEANWGNTVRDSSAGLSKASPRSIASKPPCLMATMTERSWTSNASRRFTSPIFPVSADFSSSWSSVLHMKRPFSTDLPLASTMVVLCPPLVEKNKAGGP